eukprot:2984895-Rhodomonas_salina.1
MRFLELDFGAYAACVASGSDIARSTPSTSPPSSASTPVSQLCAYAYLLAVMVCRYAWGTAYITATHVRMRAYADTCLPICERTLIRVSLLRITLAMQVLIWVCAFHQRMRQSLPR